MTTGILKSYQRLFKQTDPPISGGGSVTGETGEGLFLHFGFEEDHEGISQAEQNIDNDGNPRILA